MEKSAFVSSHDPQVTEHEEPATKSAATAPDKKVQKCIEELASLTADTNWDDEHGLAIGRSEWNRAWEFYKRLRKKGIPNPFIAPCGDGSIHFNWVDESRRRLNLELKENNYWWS